MRVERGQPIADDHVRPFDASTGDPQTVARAATDQDHWTLDPPADCSTVAGAGAQPAHHDHEQPPQSSDHARRHPWPAPPTWRGEVIRRRRATAHDQQSPCREVGDGRTDLGRDYRYHCLRVQQAWIADSAAIRLRRPALGGRPAQGWRRSLLVAGSAWRREVTTQVLAAPNPHASRARTWPSITRCSSATVSGSRSTRESAPCRWLKGEPLGFSCVAGLVLGANPHSGVLITGRGK